MGERQKAKIEALEGLIDSLEDDILTLESALDDAEEAQAHNALIIDELALRTFNAEESLEISEEELEVALSVLNEQRDLVISLETENANWAEWLGACGDTIVDYLSGNSRDDRIVDGIVSDPSDVPFILNDILSAASLVSEFAANVMYCASEFQDAITGNDETEDC